MYAEFQMPRAIKKSEPFNIEIYKDQSLKQLVVQMTEGVSINVANIDAGKILDLGIKPYSDLVQTKTNFQFTFTTAHKLEKDSKLVLSFPDSIGLPSQFTEQQVLMVTDKGNYTISGSVSGQNVTFENFL